MDLFVPDSILGVPRSRDPQGRDAAEPAVRLTLLLRAAEQLDAAAATDEEGGVDADASINGGGETVHNQTRYLPPREVAAAGTRTVPLPPASTSHRQRNLFP